MCLTNYRACMVLVEIFLVENFLSFKSEPAGLGLMAWFIFNYSTLDDSGWMRKVIYIATVPIYGSS